MADYRNAAHGPRNIGGTPGPNLPASMPWGPAHYMTDERVAELAAAGPGSKAIETTVNRLGKIRVEAVDVIIQAKCRDGLVVYFHVERNRESGHVEAKTGDGVVAAASHSIEGLIADLWGHWLDPIDPSAEGGLR